MPGVELLRNEAEPLARSPRWKAIGSSRSRRPTSTRVGASGQVASGHGSKNGVSASGCTPRAPTCATTSFGTSCRNSASGSVGASGSHPCCSSNFRRACACPVVVHHSPPSHPAPGSSVRRAPAGRRTRRRRPGLQEGRPATARRGRPLYATRSRPRRHRRTPADRPRRPRTAGPGSGPHGRAPAAGGRRAARTRSPSARRAPGRTWSPHPPPRTPSGRGPRPGLGLLGRAALL